MLLVTVIVLVQACVYIAPAQRAELLLNVLLEIDAVMSLPAMLMAPPQLPVKLLLNVDRLMVYVDGKAPPPSIAPPEVVAVLLEKTLFSMLSNVPA